MHGCYFADDRHGVDLREVHRDAERGRCRAPATGADQHDPPGRFVFVKVRQPADEAGDRVAVRGR